MDIPQDAVILLGAGGEGLLGGRKTPVASGLGGPGSQWLLPSPNAASVQHSLSLADFFFPSWQQHSRDGVGGGRKGQ